jgi:hypothetical protein
MTDLVFVTGGDWDSTTLHNNGFELAAQQLLLEIRAGRDEFDEPIDGGIWEGCDMTAFVRPMDNPDAPFDALPGRITLRFPFHEVIVENITPFVDPRGTRVFLDGRDVSDQLVDLVVNIDAGNDMVEAVISVYRNRFLFRDEVIITDLLGN